MKKTILSCIICCFLLSLVTTDGFAETAEKVLEKMIAAQGGRKALSAIKDSTMSGTMEMVMMGASGSMTMYSKEPDKMRLDIELMGMMMTQAYDGKTAWMINPQTGAAEELSEKMTKGIKRQAMGQTALLNPKKLGIKYTFKGKEKIADKDYLVLEQSFEDGHKNTIYIDAKTYLVYKTKGTSYNDMETEVEAEAYQSDYKKFEGILMPQAITVFQDGQEYLKFSITEVSFNTDLEDSLFKMDE